jgi:predicted PurR-regulated permease PerM
MTGWERAQAVSIVMLAILAGIGALYVGRELCIPLALALLLNALLRPVVRSLERLRVSTAIGATLVSLGLLGVLVAGGWALVTPVRTWVSQLPATFEAAGRKLAPARQSLEQVSQATHMFGEPSGAPGAAPASRAAPAAPVVPPFLAQLFGTTAALIAGLAGVLLLLYLLLASGDLFLRKLVEVLPLFRDKRLAVEVTEQVQQAVTRYLVATLMINGGQGIVVGLALWGLGMPYPWLWGGLTVLLEFIPYLGALGMIILLTATAFSQFETLGHILLIPGTYLVITALQNNLVSPLVYGQHLKLNPVAVLVCAVLVAALGRGGRLPGGALLCGAQNPRRSCRESDAPRDLLGRINDRPVAWARRGAGADGGGSKRNARAIPETGVYYCRGRGVPVGLSSGRLRGPGLGPVVMAM